jgi:hypothetical protein
MESTAGTKRESSRVNNIHHFSPTSGASLVEIRCKAQTGAYLVPPAIEYCDRYYLTPQRQIRARAECRPRPYPDFWMHNNQESRTIIIYRLSQRMQSIGRVLERQILGRQEIKRCRNSRRETENRKMFNSDQE